MLLFLWKLQFSGNNVHVSKSVNIDEKIITMGNRIWWYIVQKYNRKSNIIDCTKSIDKAQKFMKNEGYNERYINIHIVKNWKIIWRQYHILNDYLDTKNKLL